jgi:hypothetical protein
MNKRMKNKNDLLKANNSNNDPVKTEQKEQIVNYYKKEI